MKNHESIEENLQTTPQAVEGLQFLTIGVGGEGKPRTFQRLALGGEDVEEKVKQLITMINQLPDDLSFQQLQKEIFRLLPSCNLSRVDH